MKHQYHIHLESSRAQYVDQQLIVNFKEHQIRLSWEHFDIKVEGSKITLFYLNRVKNKAGAIAKTWSNLIKKYEANPTFNYTVVPTYKHFPIKLSLEPKGIGVYNYMGIKTKFIIPFSAQAKIVNNVLEVTTKNDVLTGSELNGFKALRYKCHHHDLDRRKFTDGFTVTKWID